MPFPFPGDLPDPEIKPYLLCQLHWQGYIYIYIIIYIYFATEPPGKPESIKRLTLNQTSQFIIYLSCFCFTLYVIGDVSIRGSDTNKFVHPREVSLNSLGFVLSLSLEKGK